MTFLQAFYRDDNNHLCSSWQNPDGSWQQPAQDLGGLLNGGPAAAQLPGTGVIQVFYRGLDNGVWSRWRDPSGGWSGEQRIGGVLNGDPIAAALPGVDYVIQLFYRGSDNCIWSRWRMPEPSDGWSANYWSNEQQLTYQPINGDPIVTALPGGSQVIQLFYRDSGNVLLSRWRDPAGNWQPSGGGEQNLGPVLNADPIAAQVPGGDVLQLFYASGEAQAINSILSVWRDPGGNWEPCPAGQWCPPGLGEQNLGGIGLTLAAAQVPGTEKLLLLFVDGNTLGSMVRDPALPGTYWSAPAPVPGNYTLNEGCGLTALQRPGTSIIDVFYVNPGGTLAARSYNPDGSWSGEATVGSGANSFKFAVVEVG